MYTKGKKITLPEDNRIIAISDIHGNLDYLKALLEKVKPSKKDCLVLVGDSVEKGPESLDTLRYLMKLSETYHVEVLLGNCEAFVLHILESDTGRDKSYINYLLCRKSLIKEMCEEQKIPVSEHTDLNRVRTVLKQRYQNEIEFLKSCPVVLETERAYFVHAGLQSEDLSAQDWNLCLKCDHFMTQTHIFTKYCVVGHWPVVLYHQDRPVANPLIDREHRTISIDGGCILRDDGQLNALLLSPDGQGGLNISWDYYDHFRKAIVLDCQEISNQASFHLSWADRVVEVLEQDEEFSYCRHKTTGYCMWILNRYLYENHGVINSNDCTDYLLPVEAGEEVSVVEVTSRGYLIKKDGCSGWYTGRLVYADEGHPRS